jgi:hypothetical protein
MKCTPISIALAALILCALSAGCTSPTQTGINTPATTGVPLPSLTTSTSTATVVSTPISVETLPAEQTVDVQVYKQRPDATIHLTYNGGRGEIFVRNIMMRVTLSTGQVNEQYLNNGARNPQRGDELVMSGTRGTDQVAVFLTTSGRTYKIYDMPLSNPYY